MGEGAENTQPERLVHASIIDPRDIRVRKRANGQDWLLGAGSFGTVSPNLCVVPTLAHLRMHTLHMCLCRPAVYTAFAPAWSFPWPCAPDAPEMRVPLCPSPNPCLPLQSVL